MKISKYLKPRKLISQKLLNIKFQKTKMEINNSSGGGYVHAIPYGLSMATALRRLV